MPLLGQLRHSLQPDVLHDGYDRLHIRLGEHAGDALIAQVGVGVLIFTQN
jgi:hypothetical protein